ncbi:pyridoxal phosphate-dependent aminotransferase [Aquamicrobium sp. LC103]|uniref:pyridoxal phosphate-dependent aminotransferase n=1 Tax=Aquamicrobium sp. LC103 TaxID=1120658 RepID=UPI00063EBC93|nr:pyridoxal phosphate-dependent aminotransferase [Aquamicrobium sp. LC103]TKT69584.1 pyridoxal phosphate-dependent aminotransferase [Aquamicrobium sp. LC103]
MSILSKFSRLGTDNAPGQEVRQQSTGLVALLRGEVLEGTPVDFSHGDVDAFEPTPGSFETFSEGVSLGGRQAYTEYRGDIDIREQVAEKLAAFTGAPVNARDGMIITPGTQGALFLAVAATVSRGDKVAIVQPDYFANRKLVEFFEGEMIPVRLDYSGTEEGRAGLDLDQLEAAFEAGAKIFLFSNPNNPAGVVYSKDEIRRIAELAGRYGATVIVDQLYSRLRYQGVSYTHLRAQEIDAENVVTIMGPSKTESLSGYRLGVAFGSSTIINRMEKLQAIVSLRAAGYSQAVLRTWFNEPEGWMDERIRLHQAIRDDLLKVLQAIDGAFARAPEAGSYLFPRLPDLGVSHSDFVKLLRIQAGVVVTPGTEFSPHSANSVRLNFSQDHKAAVAAVERMAELIARYRV